MKIPIKSPCEERWDAMRRGEDGRRFCELCNKHVYNVSTMTTAEACTLLERRNTGESICVRTAVDRNGDVVFFGKGRAVAGAVVAAGIAASSPAMADGTIPTLQALTEVEEVQTVQNAAAVDPTAETDGEELEGDPLADVEDIGCEGNKAAGAAPVTINPVDGEPVEVVDEPDDYLYMLGGI